MHGVSKDESISAGSLPPNMQVQILATMIATIAPKNVYHIYEMRYNGKTVLEMVQILKKEITVFVSLCDS